MRFIKQLLTVLTLSIFLGSCKVISPADIQTTPSFEFLEAPYFQSWLAGVRGGGSGINVFIPYRNLNRTKEAPKKSLVHKSQPKKKKSSGRRS